jgi:ATP-dependent helicase Lhr and Lhr-like helicase
MGPQEPTTPFRRLHPLLQESLYRMSWSELRQIQVDAIHEVFDGAEDIIISARTASGKTEAAFLPVLSTLLEEPSSGVRALYVGPLKALINDQFSRLDELCQEAEIPVHKWHGDVSSGAKRRLLEKPAGVLLITPESIESLFVNHSDRIPGVFRNLSFIVIDELHSFLGTERGAHLRSLTTRLAAKAQCPVRRIGLSATLGEELQAACRWLCPTDPTAVRMIVGSETKSVRLNIAGYLVRGRPQLADPTNDALELPNDDGGSLETDVFEAFQGQTGLVFANSKSQIEALADRARRESIRRGLADSFRVHYGSLSKVEREDTEDALKSTQPAATFCSSTLEMGIDVGNVRQIGQVGCPWSVSSLAQRLGRSGRRDGEPQIMRIYIAEDLPEKDTPIIQRLFPELIQSIAMTELLREKWCEPPEIARLNLSTLVQQILSLIVERGGSRAQEIHHVLVAQGAFPNVDKPKLIAVLRCMGRADLIEQTPDGLLVTGLLGEKIVRSHDFYVAFVVHEEYRVTEGGRHIGNVAGPDFDVGTFLILAGRRWRIDGVDHERKVVLVQPAPGGRVPRFISEDWQDLHPMIRERMRALLARTDLPAFLNATAKEMLTQARATARDSGLLSSGFIQDGPDAKWFPWTGTRIQRTLLGLAKFFGGIKVSEEMPISTSYRLALAFQKSTVSRVRETLRSFLHKHPDAVTLATQYDGRIREKYEQHLSDELTAEIFARERIDLDGALARIREIETN